MEITTAPIRAKNPRKVQAGRLGAAARWGDGPPRVVRLDDLTAPQRRLVLAAVAAARAFAEISADDQPADAGRE